MTRKCKSWILSYVEYASVTEAPKKMHFWAGVSAIAGVLRRRVWINMVRFKWYPSFYIIFVAPPGVVSKTTTVDGAMSLLREVPGIKFGPDIITWPALVVAFSESTECFEYREDFIPMSAMTLEAGELGNLIDPQDRAMLNLYITLWDGTKKLSKTTKTSGSETIEAPWINMIGCTTPSWIADNMPVAAIGGGFTSRCIFVYADTKDKYIPYVDEVVSTAADEGLRADLLEDLIHISTTLVGAFTISEEARIWGRSWYQQFWEASAETTSDSMRDGYVARKQTHLHKVAMILSAARSDDMVITLEDVVMADQMLLNIEPDMAKVFSKIGKTDDSLRVEQFLDFIRRKKEVPYETAYAHVHFYFTDFRDFEGVLNGCVRAGLVALHQRAGVFWVVYTGDKNEK